MFNDNAVSSSVFFNLRAFFLLTYHRACNLHSSHGACTASSRCRTIVYHHFEPRKLTGTGRSPTLNGGEDTNKVHAAPVDIIFQRAKMENFIYSAVSLRRSCSFRRSHSRCTVSTGRERQTSRKPRPFRLHNIRFWRSNWTRLFPQSSAYLPRHNRALHRRRALCKR